MKAMIEAGAAGVHFEDQLASEKKCGHMGGKVLVPTSQFIRTLIAARLAADVCDVPTLVDRPHRRRQREAAHLATSTRATTPFIVDRRAHRRGLLPHEGRPRVRRSPAALAYAPYADLIWCETSTPDLAEAKQFAEAVHEKFPGKLLAYNCSPSFNWKKNLDDATIAKFQRELGAMGYKFQFVTLAGFHALNYSMFELAARLPRARDGRLLPSSSRRSSRAEKNGYTATQAPARGRHRLLRRGRRGRSPAARPRPWR